MATITLDKEREIKLTLGAMKKFKEKTGVSLLQENSLDNVDEDKLSVLIWCCLIHEDKELTIDQVDNMIHLGNINDVVKALEKAFSEAKIEGGSGKNKRRPTS